MGEARSTFGEKEMLQGFGREFWSKESLGRRRRSWYNNNIKMELKRNMVGERLLDSSGGRLL